MQQDMDQAKLAYFVSKYRAMDNEELAEICTRLNSLAEEATAAAQQVSTERGLAPPSQSEGSRGTHNELTDVERAEQTQVSSELWNSPLSKRVQFQFAAHAIVFSMAMLGSTGLRVGALWLVAVAGVLYYGASKFGRRHTKAICADSEKTVAEKTDALRRSSIILWPTLVVAALLGAVLSNVLRGA